eukprot:COSAG06_NODE_4795_length_3948_cov_10.578852_2_plen_32_part_00
MVAGRGAAFHDSGAQAARPRTEPPGVSNVTL